MFYRKEVPVKSKRMQIAYIHNLSYSMLQWKESSLLCRRTVFISEQNLLERLHFVLAEGMIASVKEDRLSRKCQKDN